MKEGINMGVETHRSCKLFLEPSCDGHIRYSCMYFPTTKEVVYYKTTVPGYALAKETFNEFIEHSFERGTHNVPQFKVLIENVPDFRKVWRTVEKTLKSNFETGEYVIKWNGNRADIYVVGEIEGWFKICDRQSGKSRIECCRRFYDSVPTSSYDPGIRVEDEYTKLSKLEEWKAGHKVILRIKKALKIDGVIGAVIAYGGKSYRV